MTRNLLAVAFAVTLAACTPPKNHTVDQAAELEALMKVSSDWSDSLASAPTEDVLAGWADDAVMAPPDFDFVDGKEAIAAYLGSYMGEDAVVPNFSIEWTPKTGFVSASGDLAYLIETNLIQFDDADGNRISMPNKVVTVWRKDDSGKWKNVVDMWNSFPSQE